MSSGACTSTRVPMASTTRSSCHGSEPPSPSSTQPSERRWLDLLEPEDRVAGGLGHERLHRVVVPCVEVRPHDAVLLDVALEDRTGVLRRELVQAQPLASAAASQHDLAGGAGVAHPARLAV